MRRVSSKFSLEEDFSGRFDGDVEGFSSSTVSSSVSSTNKVDRSNSVDLLSS